MSENVLSSGDEGAAPPPSPIWIVCLALYYRAILFLAEQATGSALPNNVLFVGLAMAVSLVGWRSVHLLLGASVGSALRGWWLLAAWAATSLLWTRNVQYGFDKLGTFVALGMIPGVVAAAFAGGKRSWSPALVGGLLFAGLTLTQGTYQLDGRLSIEGNNPIWVARSCLMAASIAVWAPSCSMLLRLVTASVTIYVALMTGSRGPLTSFVTAPILVWTWEALNHRAVMSRSLLKRLVLLVLLVEAAVAFALLKGAHDVPEGSARRQVLSRLQPNQSLAEDPALIERRALRERAFELFVDAPLWGAGIGGNAPLGQIEYPHLLPLEIASELGIVGLAIWLVAVAGGLARARHDRLLFILYLQAILYSMSSGDLSANEMVVLFSCLGGATAAASGHPAPTGARPPPRLDALSAYRILLRRKP